MVGIVGGGDNTTGLKRGHMNIRSLIGVYRLAYEEFSSLQTIFLKKYIVAFVEVKQKIQISFIKTF